MTDYNINVNKPALLQQSNDGNLLLFYSNNDGDVHKIDPDFNILWSRDILLGGTSNYSRMIGRGDQAGRVLDNGDILFVASYITQAELPAVLVHADPEGYVSVDDTETPAPTEQTLTAYPNPFNPETTLRFDLEHPGQVSLDIYNVRGQLVATLLDEPRPAGAHTVTWTADGCTSGIYFAKLKINNQNTTTKLLLLK
ncbi:MAG: T9SS type A sorting domain-containing protein [Candidatus Cloacimonetes bacterium]|nr:T9SS type A sorting domain-containing protein [Candidatus Cloacimonadota bacterium]